VTTQITSELKRYLSVETAGGASWDPTGKEIAFVYDSAGFFQVYSVNVDETVINWPKRITFETDRCTNPRFLSDGTIIFTQDKGGNENFQIGVYTQNQEVKWITSDQDSKHFITTATKSFLYYSANIEEKSTFSIYRHAIPLEDNEPELIFHPSPGIYQVTLTSTDDNLLIIQHIESSMKSELLQYNVKTKKIRSLTSLISRKSSSRWSSVRWIDKEHLLVITDHDCEYLRLAILSVNGEFKTISEVEKNTSYNLSTAAWTEESPYTYFATNQDGYSTISRAIVTLSGMSKLSEVELPYKGVITLGDDRSFKKGMTLSPKGNYLAVTLSSPTNPSNIWVINLELKKAFQVTKAEMSGLNQEKFVDATLNIFNSFDGIEIPYFQYIPKGKKPKKGWPAIFIIHGGPEAQVRPSFISTIQFFLSAGFAVITPNIRGSAGYSRTYLDLDNIEKRLDSIKDIAHLVNYIKKKSSEIDTNRLVVYGGSYGGFAVLSSLTEYPELWKGGVDIVGIANFVTFLQNTAAWRRKHREAEYGSLKNDMDTLVRISPINKIDNIKASVFIAHGDNDERVPLSETLQIHDKLKERNLKVKLLRFSDEGHGVTKLKNRLKLYTEILQWLKETI
jgi:dipeptidyl aminopeptidase/acylaminoacyl peptidase